jgi:GDP-L-fucose synthase
VINKHSKIYIAGHRGLVGSAIIRELKNQGYDNFIFKTHSELDLMNQQQVADFFTEEKPEFVFLAAAKVGGIHANNVYPAEFIYGNLAIQNNIIHNAYKNKVERLLFLGSSCIYPKLAPQPMSEDCLLTSQLEATNEPYAVAKIAGIKMCESYNRQYNTDYRSAMPTNLYGQGDNFDLENSHVIPALLRKFHEAKINNDKTVTVWGSGKVSREFLFVDDLAKACVHLMTISQEAYTQVTEPMLSHINIGTGADVTIKQLAELVQKVVDFKGEIVWDKTKPDGTPRKLLDVSKINQLGWKAQTSLENGLNQSYQWFVNDKK